MTQLNRKRPNSRLKVISGGQTGVDRAALDVALALGIKCGGWCPMGRRAEDGRIADKYPLEETTWEGYPQRTEWNVRDSDATLVLRIDAPDRGTALTIELAEKKGKPCYEAILTDADELERVLRWLRAFEVDVLNVAGPRESSSEGIHDLAASFLEQLFMRHCGAQN